MSELTTRLLPVSLYSGDRDESLFPEPNHYVAELPFTVPNVVGIQVASLEMPEVDAQYTIEQDRNDKVSFSEGLRIDFNDLVSDVVPGVDMYANQIAFLEGSNVFSVSIPAYLTEIDTYSSDYLVTYDLASDFDASTNPDTPGWRTCYVNWQAQVSPSSPVLECICSTAGYRAQVTSSNKLSNTSHNSLFRYGFVHLAPLSVQEICSYLTYAFANYTTYKPAQATFMTNRYTFEYFRGKVRIVVSSLSSSSVVPRLVFPTNTNPAQTADYGSQNNGFATRMLLNNPTPQCTTLGYMLGLTSGVSAATKNFVYKDHQEPRFGFFANTEPRFLFEARLAPGMYSVQDLTTYLPIAMNPLNFEAPSSTSSVATATGSCYFAFQDSRGLESLIIINSGQYTPETFCQALEHALNRMDSQGAYYSAYANRFAYNNVSLNYDPDTQWQVLEIPAAVVYNVVYDFSTSKFTISSSFAQVRPFNSGEANILSTTRRAPTFGLLLSSPSTARVSLQVSDIASFCPASNVHRIARVLGMDSQDYLGKSSYTSEFASFVPRIAFPLSSNSSMGANRALFRQEATLPMSLGVDGESCPGAGTPTYLYPSGTYKVHLASPTSQTLIVSSVAPKPIESSGNKLASSNSTGVCRSITTNIAAKGFVAANYTLAPPTTPGSLHTPGSYLVIENLPGPDATWAAIVKVLTTSQNATSSVVTAEVVDVGTGTAGTAQTFYVVEAHDNLRLLAVNRGSGDNEPHIVVSTHANGYSSTGKAYMTTSPFGAQVSDVMSINSGCSKILTSTTLSEGTLPDIGGVLGPNRGLILETTYTLASGVVAVGAFYAVCGGNYDAVVQGTTTSAVKVVVSGSGFFPGTTGLSLVGPSYFGEFEGIVVANMNSGGHFDDATNAYSEQFLSCVPWLDRSSTTCVAGKSVDNACLRLRAPATIQVFGQALQRLGNLKSARLPAPRFDVHVEDDNSGVRTKPGHAATVLGTGRTNLLMSRSINFPDAANIDAVHYLLVKFVGMNNARSDHLHFTNSTLLRDVVAKVIMGAPTSIVRSLISRVEFAQQSVSRLELMFYLPDGSTLYDFHGREHSMTLNLVIKDPTAVKRKASPDQDHTTKRACM
jgi:hypothetical protein